MLDPTLEVKGTWIPLLDYALKNGVSLSTLRRHIKNNKVLYRVENGRYLLWQEGEEICPTSSSEVDKLNQDLKKAHEEIAELKTLIALYEEKISP